MTTPSSPPPNEDRQSEPAITAADTRAPWEQPVVRSLHTYLAEFHSSPGSDDLSVS